jgi:hypothetical protein
LAPIASIYSSADENNNNISMPQTNYINTDLNPNQFKIPEYKSSKQTGVFINDNPNNPPFNTNEMENVQSVLNEQTR